MKILFRPLFLTSLLFLWACGGQPRPSLNPSSVPETGAVRFNALISCLGGALPQSLLTENAFKVVDYYGEPASLGRADLGASKLQDPWCLLSVDVKGYSADEAFDKLETFLNTEPTVWLRALSEETKPYGQDHGVHSFDPKCKDLPLIDLEASAALPLGAGELRASLGVTDPKLTGRGTTIAVFDSGVSSPHDFAGASPVGGFSRNFLGHDYPVADPNRFDIGDRFDCSETLYPDRHGSLVTEIIRSVAPDADLVMFKVCDDDGYCPGSGLAKALLYLSNDYENFPTVDIINMSFGADIAHEDPVLRALLERMAGMNYETLIVTSLGNSADAEAHYPADYAYLNYGMIPVAAAKRVAQTGDAWRLAEFNTRPLLARMGKDVLAAPGVRLKLGQGNPEGVTGTSFAAPVVAGVAALERQRRPLQNPTSVSLHMNLLANARPMGDVGFTQLGD